MNDRPISVSIFTLALVGLVACGGGGKTSESAGESSSAAQTTGTSAGSTGSETTAVTGSGSTAGTGSASESNSSVATSDPTTGATGSSGTSATGTGSTSGTTSTGSTGGTTGSSSSTGTTGDVCVDQAGSCAKGEACCDGLECCAGVPVPPGQEFCGVECPKSDRNVKRAFLPVDAADVLRRVVALEITTWEYKKDPADLRHLGPMAQDFKQAFGLGHDDKTIFPLDASGVAMAAIQALHAENEALRERLAQLELRLAKQGR
jgi:hypothetical protein